MFYIYRAADAGGGVIVYTGAVWQACRYEGLLVKYNIDRPTLTPALFR